MNTIKCLMVMLYFFISFSSNAQTSKVNSYPLKEGLKTVVEGIYSDTIKQLYIWVTDYSKYIDWLNQEPTIVPVKNGRFRFETTIKNPVYISLGYWGIQLISAFNGRSTKGYMQMGLLTEPGDSLFVDEREFSYGYDRMKVSGKGAEKTWAEQAIIKNTRLYDFPFGEGGKSLPRPALQDSIANMVIKTLDVYKHRLSSSAYSIIKGNYIPMLNLGGISKIILDNNWDINSSQIRKVFEKQLALERKWIDLTNPDLIYTLYNFEGMFTTAAWLKDAIEKERKYDSYAPFSKIRYDALIRQLPNSPFKERIIANYLIKSMQKEDSSGELKLCTEKFLNGKDMRLAPYAGVYKVFKDYSNQFAKGSNAFPFTLPDTLGNFYSLKDFKGKVVLIDFMFTGCIGCAGMVPALKKVEELYKENKEVVFISVSIDKKFEWRRIGNVPYYVPGSLLLYTDNWGDKHPLIKHYQIRSYPKLVLIDKEGKLISANAPRPDADNGLALTRMINVALNSK